jgi:hypothetical protein
MFYAQRNVYLTGSTIFLALILNRFYYMVLELLKNEEKAEVLKQQAAKTSKEYMKLLDGDQEKESELSLLKKELEEAKTKGKDIEILRKQAERTTQGTFFYLIFYIVPLTIYSMDIKIRILGFNRPLCCFRKEISKYGWTKWSRCQKRQIRHECNNKKEKTLFLTCLPLTRCGLFVSYRSQ